MKNKKFICGKILYIISFFIIVFYLYIELGNIVFNPLIKDKKFNEEYVEQEKENMSYIEQQRLKHSKAYVQ